VRPLEALVTTKE